MPPRVSKYSYRGIALFGPPGSGKTVLAKHLHSRLRGSFYLEASRDILPEFIDKKTLSRPASRSAFRIIRKKHGVDAIAKKVEIIVGKRKGFPVISGIRGYDNAKYLRERGFYIVYLDAPVNILEKRLMRRNQYAPHEAKRDIENESRLYNTDAIRKLSDGYFSTNARTTAKIAKDILASGLYRECRMCVNSNRNPAIKIGQNGLCEICFRYRQYYRKSVLKKELRYFKSFVGNGSGKYDILVGISGGKDSSAMLYMLKKRGFRILAFTFDTGYYPKSIFTRAAEVARRLGVDYQKIDIRKYIRPTDRKSYALMADLYDEKPSASLREKFRRLYAEGRTRYSVNEARPFPFMRTCQLCRKVVIRAYYAEALKRNVPIVVLGINEWAHLSKHGDAPAFSAIRKLKPFKNKTAVYVVHSPFLFQRRAAVTKKILREMGWWKLPMGEKLIESNANSCLLARAAEKKAVEMLGFHPDYTRLAREVTAGFITKKQAQRALGVIHRFSHTVRGVLQRAEILS